MNQTLKKICIRSLGEPFQQRLVEALLSNEFVESAGLADEGMRLTIEWIGDAPGETCLNILKDFGWDMCRLENV